MGIVRCLNKIWHSCLWVIVTTEYFVIRKKFIEMSKRGHCSEQVCEKGLRQYVERGRYNKFKQDTLKIVTLNLKLKNYKI
jgi:hypothetical protein